MLKNVVFMGTPDFAVGTLQALIASEYHVQAVFTQPDKPVGRKAIMTPPPVKVTAMEAGIPVYQPVKIREEENIRILEQLNPDCIVVAAFGQIIPKRILDMPKYGCINVHASLLPKYRGAAPIQYAVIDGEKESGVTTMKMGTGLDTGDMIMKGIVPLAEDETGGSLFDKLADCGAKLLIETLNALDEGTAVFEKQPEESPTPYAAMLTKKDGEIDWSKDACAIERLVRGLTPWPTAYTYVNGKQLKIWSSCVAQQENKTADAAGTVVQAGNGQIVVNTGNGQLLIREVQLEGKKRMDVDAFLRGFSLEAGTVLGR